MKKILIIIFGLFYLNAVAQENENSSAKTSAVKLLQTISVTIGGEFIVTGSYPAFKTQRLDNFITSIYNEARQAMLGSITQPELLSKIRKEVEGYPLRDITLKRANGEILKIDLLKFRLTGDFRFNPYLMDDDVIIFPAYDAETNFVEISGAVNKPAKFQFVEGDKISDAILLAGGVNFAYNNVSEAEISRLKNGGTEEELIRVKLTDDFTLQRGDRIKVLYEENNKRVFQALVLGEVNRPGFVYLTKDGNPIWEVLEKAGGLKLTASLKDAELLRDGSANEILLKNEIVDKFKQTPASTEFQMLFYMDKMKKNKLALWRLSNLTVEDTLFFYIDNELRLLNEHKYLDFEKLSNPNSEERNFVVKDGDLILIPEKFDYVYVFGQVPKVGYFPYEKGKDYKYYIYQAGGLSETARDLDEVAIIKGNTKDWIVEKKELAEIEPGDFVYVPKEIPRTFSFYLQRVSSVAQIIGSIATIILLLTQFGK